MLEEERETLQKLLIIKLASIKQCEVKAEDFKTAPNQDKEVSYGKVKQYDLGELVGKNFDEIQS